MAAWRVGAVIEETVAENVRSIQDAEQLGGVLLAQKGLVSRYFLAADDAARKKWRKTLDERESRFRKIIADVRATTHISPREADVLSQIETAYADLVADRTAALLAGPRGTGAETSDQRVRGPLRPVRGLRRRQQRGHQGHHRRAMTRVRQATWLVGLSVTMTIALGGALLWMLVLSRACCRSAEWRPTPELFRGDAPAGSPQAVDDELRAVGDSLRTLMSDVVDARSRLERSRDRLQGAEKLASVGKLAAGVAHEIRNPLTAMKMWLFSIREAVEGNPDLERKVRVVSEEVVRLESIVRSFLEFSRPPATKPRPMDVADIVGHTLELLSPRLREAKVRVGPQDRGRAAARFGRPRTTQAGVHQPAGQLGRSHARKEAKSTSRRPRNATSAGRPMVVVRVQDTGPGMSARRSGPGVRAVLFHQGRRHGLGLCIAAQIMARHGGLLVLESSSSQGTTFAVWIPVATEEERWQGF